MSSSRKLKRDDIIEAVLQLLAEDGPEHIGAIAVARKLGVAPLAPYEYFSGRTEMLDAALDTIHERVSRSLAKAERTAPTPLDALRIFIESGAELMPFISIIPRLLLSGAAQPGGWTEHLRRREAETEAHLKRIISAGQATGQIRDDMSPPTLARAYLGCATQLYNRWARTSDPVDLPTETHRVWEQFEQTATRTACTHSLAHEEETA